MMRAKTQSIVSLLNNDIDELLDEQNKWANEDIQTKITQVEQLSILQRSS